MSKLDLKINKLYKTKTEDKYFEPFLKFYVSKYFPKYKDVTIQAPDTSNQYKKRPDYYIEQTSCLVEVKEVHDRKETEVSIAWQYRSERLGKNINNDSRIKDIKGTFRILTPRNMHIKGNGEKTFKNKVFATILSDKTSCDVFGYRLRTKKVNNRSNYIYFMSTSGGFIDSAFTINKNISDKLATANEQLKKFTPPKRKVTRGLDG